MKNKIINTSPFRVESQIVPNDEKEKFLKAELEFNYLIFYIWVHPLDELF